MMIPKRSRRQGGFTLIELMISAALIGVLAAIAIPNFIAYQARSRRSEAYANLASVARAYKSYAAETGAFPDMGTLTGETSLPKPGDYGGLGTTKMPWDGPTNAFFDLVGWKAEGSVFYTYDVNSAVACSCTLCFTATAHGDVDGDTGWSALMYVHPQRNAAGAVTGECPSNIALLTAPQRNGQAVYDEVALNPTRDLY